MYWVAAIDIWLLLLTHFKYSLLHAPGIPDANSFSLASACGSIVLLPKVFFFLKKKKKETSCFSQHRTKLLAGCLLSHTCLELFSQPQGFYRKEVPDTLKIEKKNKSFDLRRLNSCWSNLPLPSFLTLFSRQPPGTDLLQYWSVHSLLQAQSPPGSL